MKSMKLVLALAAGVSVVSLAVYKYGPSKYGQCLINKISCSSNCCAAKNNCSSMISENKNSDSSSRSYCIDNKIEHSDDNSKILVKFNAEKNLHLDITLVDNPILTEKVLEQKILDLVGQHIPNFKMADIPAQQLKMMLDQIVAMEIIKQCDLEEFFASKDRTSVLARKINKVITEAVNEYSMEKVKSKLEVSSKEITSEYENNKSRYIKELGGVRLVAVKYENKEDAEQQIALLSEKEVQTVVDFAREIKESEVLGGQLKDFGYVSKLSPRGAALELVEAAENLSEYPSLDIVSLSENENWLLMATELKETTYYSFDECKQRISYLLEQKAFEKKWLDYVEKNMKKVKPEVLANNSDDNNISSSELADSDLAEYDEDMLKKMLNDSDETE